MTNSIQNAQPRHLINNATSYVKAHPYKTALSAAVLTGAGFYTLGEKGITGMAVAAALSLSIASVIAARTTPAPKAIAPRKVEEVVILGSGAAGSSAAVFAAQANRRPLVIQDVDCNAQMALVHKIDNYPGILEEIEGVELLNRFREQAKVFGARFRDGSVLEADLQNRPFRIKLASGQTIYTKALIVAVGTKKQWLGLPNEQALRGHGITAASFCKETDFRNKNVVVVGGGHAALQEAHFLSAVAKKVILVNRGSTFNASKFHQNLVMNNKKIQILYNTKVEDILDVSKKIFTGIVLKNEKTNEINQIFADVLLVAVGSKPNSQLFKDQLEISPKGQIVINGKNSSTNVPGVFAAGDVSDVSYGRVVIAAGSGAMAALDAVRFLESEHL